jgi:probable poly-beta-1,6-N-acetyl-D-glucosamine export protein
MTKRLLLLNGLAVLMVPLHHATAFGLQAMFEWTYRYQSVTVPNYDQLGSLAYIITMAIRQLDAFAIPAFLFVSGFFLAFIARGKELKFSAITPRIKVLLIPLFIWLAIRFIVLRRPPGSIYEVLDTYYYLVLLIQYYVLALLIVPAAKKNWKLVLLVTFLIQIIAESPLYFRTIGIEFSGLSYIGLLTPRWFFPSRIFYFSLGVVAGLHLPLFKTWVEKYKWVLLGTLIASAILSFVEYSYLGSLSEKTWIGANNPGFARLIYATTFSLCFLGFSEVTLPFSKGIEYLGSRSLGIYLVNVPVMYILAVFLFQFTPQVLGIQWVYQPLLVIVGIGVPVLLMEIVRRSPLRKGYRYLFG